MCSFRTSFWLIQILLLGVSCLRESKPFGTIQVQSDSSINHKYDFVFGWSTGHVGTTTLSLPILYGNPTGVAFLHETYYGGHKMKSSDVMTK